MNLHQLPIQDRICWVFEQADRYAQAFADPSNSLERERYLAQHPTAIAAMKCMDGRINLSLATGLPMGVIQPFRNLGGMFDLGWPHLGEVFSGYVHRCVGEGRRVLLLITYHFSKGDVQRGCAGFRCDRHAAIAHTRRIQEQVMQVFGRRCNTVYPLVCGFETDEEALIFHSRDGRGDRGGMLNLSDWTAHQDNVKIPDLERALGGLLPDMPDPVRQDLLPLVYGNIRHQQLISHSPRRLEIEHREWMICLGRGFDFLHTPNLALIVGPYSPQLEEPIAKAGQIIQKNMQSGRIPPDGFLLLASSPYDQMGSDRERARLKSQFLAEFASNVIARLQPELAPLMTVRCAVMDWRTRRLESQPHAGIQCG